MKEELCSLELSKSAKEKGFNWEVRDCYSMNTEFNNHLIDEDYLEDWNSVGAISAPTLSLLQKWLREIHGIHVNIDWGLDWGYQLIPIGYTGEPFSQEFIDGKGWKSYEQALEAALLKALELIKE